MGTAFNTDEEFEAFYERHWKYIYRLCMTYMKSAADAEDCTEDVFVKVLNGSFEFTDEVHERKWLTVTAINLCKDKLKSRKRRAVASIDDEPEQAAPEKEDYSDVTEAVKQLPVKLKDVGCSTTTVIGRTKSQKFSTDRTRLSEISCVTHENYLKIFREEIFDEREQFFQGNY